MLQNFLNLEDVAILDKKQQETLKGGVGGYCRLTIQHENGSQETGGGYFNGSTGSEISSAAESFCTSAVLDSNSDVDRCFYDCAHDGFGQ